MSGVLSGVSAWAPSPISRPPISRPARNAVRRWRVSSPVQRPLWLLDEPLTALDAASQGVVGELLQEHLAAGGLLVAATHAPLPVTARELMLGRAA